MAFQTMAVTTEQVPAKLDAKSERRFFRELEPSMNVERPAIVLDCSAVQEMDSTAMHLLLSCLEGAMKRNGDVRLSGLSAQARLNLELAGIDQLFRIFATADEAVNSFRRRVAVMPHPVEIQIASENAA